MPPPPLCEIERITGKLHLSTYCLREAEREYDAFLHGEDYTFRTPDMDEDSYVALHHAPPTAGSGKTSCRPAVPLPRDPSPIRS